jgi:hypothetical protein
MVFPSKHIRLAESLLGLASFILGALSRPKTIDELWDEYQKVNNSPVFPAQHSFDNLILAADFLFMTRVIKQTTTGELLYETR